MAKNYVPEALREEGKDYSLKTPVSVKAITGETIEFSIKEGKEEKIYVLSKNDIRNIFGSL